MWEEVYDSEDSVDPKAAFFREQRIKCADQNLKSTVLLALPTPDMEVGGENEDEAAPVEDPERAAYIAAGFQYNLVQSDFSDYVKPKRKPAKQFRPQQERGTHCIHLRSIGRVASVGRVSEMTRRSAKTLPPT